MSFPAYGDYKDTGNSLLGEVPEHWHDTKLGFLCRKVGSGKTPKGGAETYVDDGVLFIRSQNVYDEGLRLDDVVYISEEVDEEMGISRVQHGDVLLNITGASLGRTCLVANDIPSANVNQHVCIIRLKDASQREFVAMAMKAFLVKSQIDACQNGAAREGLNFEQIGQLRLVVPPEDEQKAISSFLDVETSKIDGLVSEQRRLIELLKEKRQAVVSHAVTKGLDPNVPMKDSGIQWLGEVPEHWEVSRVKYYCSVKGRIGFRGYTTEDQVDEGDGALTLGATHISPVGDIVLDAPVYLSWEKYHESPEIMVKPTHILVVQRGSTCGKVGYVSDYHGPATINPSLVLIKHCLCSPKLMFYYLSSSIVQGLLACELGKTAIPMLSQEQIGDIAFCLPPKVEQDDIVAFIEARTAKTDELLAEAERAIELLQERRTALISAAVTGKIDVRGFGCKETV